mmetsp:Transcript_18828/g.30523  ORF Transcript_18828/g.30523 Transcript_18828/m.30523 type:complete len:431 (+) Transcript_18828:87-1379(+)
MITYDNSNQFMIMLSMSGSVLPQCVPVGLMTGLVGLSLALIRRFKPEWLVEAFETEDYIEDPFAIQTVAVVIGILLAMRTNMALGRWMDGISEIQVMLSKWCDAYNALNGFFSGKEADEAGEDRILLFRCRIAHWFSLMSCLAFASLRGGMLTRLEDVPIKELFSKESMNAGAKSFTTTRIYNSFNAGGQKLSDQMHLQVQADKEIGRTKKQETITSMDLFVLAAPSPEEIARLELASDKVNAVCLWIVQAIITEIRAGSLDAPPPIVTRVFQELSNGMLGFNQAHKVAMVPFPFPFAQIVSLLLLMLYCTLPFYLDVFTKNAVVTPLISFLLPTCYSGLNMIAIELEEPFGMDWNDVDIEVRHEDFLWALTDVLRMPTIPPVSEDHNLENKILRGIARGCPKLLEELEREGQKIIWNPDYGEASAHFSS